MSIVKKYKAIVEQIIKPLSDIFTVTFSTEKKFQYLPGQFLHLALDEYDGIGQWPESRCFSMQSNPEEETIKITYTAKGEFTNRMKNELNEGKEIWLKMPYGDIFQKGHDKSNCVFIAGGTGITPFLSLFASEEFNEYTNSKIYLGFRSKEYNIYNEDLSRSHNLSKSVKSFYEDTNGILNIENIFNNNGDTATYFISGPPLMIKSFKNFLLSKKIEKNRIRTDEWE